MPTLHELQSDFRCFLTGEAGEQLLQIVDGVGFSPESRLAIYRNNTLATLTAALKATFPVVCRLVDDRFFDYAAHAFIRNNLPASPCLVEYGGNFPAFLAGFPPAAGLDYLADVAALEWVINRVLRAPRPEISIPIESLLAAQGDPAQIRMRVAASCEYLASPYPIHRIWQNNRPGVAPAEMVLDRPGAWLEIRAADRARITELPLSVWTFRSQIAAGASLGAAAASALAIAPDFDLAPVIAALFSAGLVLAIL
jgi:hypothetical protein